MTLLEALVENMKPATGIKDARTAHFAFSSEGEGDAFLSEIEVEELVPLLEDWCKRQREAMRVH